ncbi:hypothetical protein MAPG_05933 [Magnaporthiopsis poae ATCC 64411]|uniref:Uncharacterized protein n=1 Tax=Magnaporthiopsis poae (strain ATCC 64411 / 73-15) TaxID=644358 RepID=A0A0C4E0Q1_MAGP6|nr:hypothetical protein MAPG_05933 [Magnaporthiopsis poae ATCC 64411]
MHPCDRPPGANHGTSGRALRRHLSRNPSPTSTLIRPSRPGGPSYNSGSAIWAFASPGRALFCLPSLAAPTREMPSAVVLSWKLLRRTRRNVPVVGGCFVSRLVPAPPVVDRNPHAAKRAHASCHPTTTGHRCPNGRPR